MSVAKYELWKSGNDSKWYWRLKSAGNGEIVCWGEGYSTKQNALNAIAWVRAYASGASFSDLSI